MIFALGAIGILIGLWIIVGLLWLFNLLFWIIYPATLIIIVAVGKIYYKLKFSIRRNLKSSGRKQ